MMEVPGLKIAGPLGKGGTAQVSKAFSTELKKSVAVKYPLLEDPDSIAQFSNLARRENKLIGKLKFSGFVNVLRHSDNPSYLLLELCNGQSLEKLGKIEDMQMLLVIISAIAADLEFIRLNNIIHCDLKPHNVFLPSDFPLYDNGDLFFAKISDFSLGRFFDEPESARAGHGTVGYAAPETAKNGKTSHKSDLFALGVIAYQLAAGQHPFIVDETDPVKIESRIQEDEPVPLTVFRSDFPAQFIELVNTLLAKDENKRPQTAWDVCKTLHGCGCQYPFEQVLAPSSLLKSHTDFEKFVGKFLELSEKQNRQLLEFTNSKPDFVRLVLSANFARKNLIYTGKRFVVKANFYWPSYLRRKSLSFFAGSDLAGKRKIIKAAISGNVKTANDAPPGTAILFSHLLSAPYLKNHSSKFAIKSESTGDFQAAVKLYLQAGQFEKALACAEKATANLIDARQRTEGIHLINRVVEYAEITGRGFDTRQLLMVKGDAQRAGGDTDSALTTYRQIIELYRGKPPDKLLAETYRDLGDLYKTKQKFDDGIKVLNRALEIYGSLRDELEESRTLNAIGGIYRIATDLPNALKFMRMALAIQKRIEAVSDAANSLNNIGLIYGIKGNLPRAIAIFNITLKMKRRVGDQQEIARTLNNLGYAHQLCGNLIDAQSFLKESLEINHRIGSKNEELNNLWILSEIMMKCGNLSEATLYVKEGLELAESLSMRPAQAYFIKSLGDIHRRMCRFSDAESCYEKATALAQEIDEKVLEIRLLISKSELRYEIGDSRAAVSLAEKATADAVSLKAEIEELQALIMLVRTRGKAENIKRARAIVRELKLTRENLLLEFAYLHFLLEINAKDDLKNLYKGLEPCLTKMQEDIEFPKLLNVAAEIHMAFNEGQKAAALLSKSLRTAHSKNLVSEEITSYILIGKMAFNESDFEKAFGNYKAALQLCKQASMTITTAEDKQLFMKKPKMVFLANQIRQLNEKIGSKQKAGV